MYFQHALKTKELLLFGDFNHNLLHTIPAPIQILLDYFVLEQIITSPTHFSSSGNAAILDLALIPARSASSFSILPPVPNSDHYSIFVSICPKPSRPPSSPSSSCTGPIRLFSKVNYDSVNQSINSISWNTLLSTNSDSSCVIFNSTLNEILQKHVPTMFPRSSSTHLPPWLTPKIKKKINHHHNTFRRAKKLNSLPLMLAYKRLRNEISYDIHSSKSNYFNSLSLSNSRTFWSHVKSIRKSSDSIPPLSSADGLPVSSDQHKSDLLNKSFCSFFNPSCPPLTEPTPSNCYPCPPEYLCSPDEIVHLIHNLPSVTACGPDGLPSKFLKSTSYSIATPPPPHTAVQLLAPTQYFPLPLETL